MITLPVSLMSIRSTNGPTTPAVGSGEASFGEILDRQVGASPAAARPASHDGGRGRVDGRAEDAPATPAGRRPEPRRDSRRDEMIEAAPTHAIDHTRDAATDPVDPAAAETVDDTDADTDADIDTDRDAVDGEESAADATAAPVRHEPACPIAVPVDGGAQSLPAPSGQAPAEAAPVAEVAAVGGTAVPAAGSVAAAVDPLTTAAAALPAPADDAGVPGADRPVGSDLPIVTNVTVETVPVADPVTVPSAPTTTPSSVTLRTSSTPMITPAVPGGAAPTTFGASPVSTPAGAQPGAPVVDPDAAPDASTHPAIGDAGWVATPTAPAPPTTAGATEPVQPTAATTAATTPATTPGPTAAVATTAAAAATAAATAADTGPAAPRPRTSAAAVDPDAPAPTAGAASTPAAAPGAPAATADAATSDGLMSAPLRTSDIAAQAQRDAQIRRAEHLTRLGLDVTTDGLGAIRIEATNAGGGLQLNLGAERASTRHLLAEQVNVLRDELGTNVSVDIGRGNTGQQSSAGGDEPRQASTSATHVVAPARTIDAGAVRRPALSHLVDADRGLDLHL